MYSETVCPVSAMKTGRHLIAFAGIFCQSTDKHWWNLVTVGYKDLDCSVQNQNGQIQLERPTLLWNWCKWMQTNRVTVSRGKREIFSWRDRKLSQCGSHCETWMKFQQFFSPPCLFFFSSPLPKFEIFRLRSAPGAMPGKAGQSCSTVQGLPCMTTCPCVQARNKSLQNIPCADCASAT